MIEAIRNNSPSGEIADVAPWSDENIVRPMSDDEITVALFSAVDVSDSQIFDAMQVDTTSVKFGVGEAQNVAPPFNLDINGDALQDVLLSFRAQQSGIVCGDTEVQLSGETYSGESFTAVASINTLDCIDVACHAHQQEL